VGGLRFSLARHKTKSYLKNNQHKKRAAGVASIAGLLLNKSKALSSTPNTAKRKLLMLREWGVEAGGNK
jgi:hypothetical protein